MASQFFNSILKQFGLVAGVALVGQCALAGPVTRANSTVTINAGVLVIDSNQISPGLVDDAAPFTFLTLDRTLLAKPSGWSFNNPFAPGIVTTSIFNRWNSLATAYGVAGPPAVGSVITKQSAAYWEVPLDQMTQGQLNAYNVLLLPAYEFISLNSKERGLLRSFVDHGGTLWVDTAPTTTADVANGIPGAAFTIATHPATSLPDMFNQFSPLLSYPSTIQNQYYTFDTTNTYNSIAPVNLSSAGYGNLIPILNTVDTDFANLHQVVTDQSGNVLVAYAHQGAGLVLITTTRAAEALGGGFYSNGGFTSNGTFLGSAPNAQLIFNAIYLNDRSAQSGGNSHKTNSTVTDTGAPLLSVFKDETEGGFLPGQVPVEYKGMLFVSQGNVLYAYSARPGSDLDFNGQADDGYPDWSLGKGYDLIWKSVALSGPLSAPVAISEPGLSGNRDFVFVVDGQGNLQEFPVFPTVGGIFPTNPNTTVSPIKSYASPTGDPAVLVGQAPLAPTAVNGLIYVTDNFDNNGNPTGRIWVVDPRTQTNVNNWCLGSAGQAVINQPVTAPVTIGYIPIADNSGGQDKVAYVPLQSGGSSGPACGIESIWLGAVGEKHPLQFDTNGDLVIPTRAGDANAPIYTPGVDDPNGIHVSLVTSNGDVLSAASMNSLLTGAVTNTGGTLVLPVQAGVNAATFASDNVTAVAVDYNLDLDYQNPDVTKVVRGVVSLPDDGNHSQNIIGPIALGSNGDIYLTEGNQADYGSFFAMQEVGRGLFTVLTRWDLYPNYTIGNLQGGTASVNEPTTFEDFDPVQVFSKFIKGPFTQLAFESGPAVSGNNVFVKARGYKNGFVPCELLLDFNANPQPASFTIPNLGSNYTIIQPDISRSLPDKTNPNVYTNALPTQFQAVQGANGTKITFSNLSSSSSQLSQVLNESMPIIVRQPGLPDEVIDPSLNGNWNTLQWYTVVHGVDPGANPNDTNPTALSGEPLVTGNTVFFDGNSIIPTVFTGGNILTAKPSGLLMAMNANISATDPYIAFDSNLRPYLHQLDALQVSGATITPNPDMRWPQMTGVTSFSDYLTRLLQTSLAGNDIANPRQVFGLASGDGGVYAYAATGIYGFRQANITVVDSNRIATLDTSGNLIWSSDQVDNLTNNGRVAGLLSQVKVAHQITPTSWLYADPNNNSVGIVDVTGHTQTFNSFITANGFQAPGYQAGETQKLNHPSDVLTYSDYVTTDPFTGQAILEYLQHFLVADTGNKRLLDLVYVYPVNQTTRAIEFSTPTVPPTLFSQSPPEFTGKNFAYNSVSRIYSQKSGTYVIAASVPDGLQSASSMGLTPVVPDPTSGTTSPQVHESSAGNGMVVIIDGTNTQVIDSMTLPAIPANVLPVPGSSPITFEPAQPSISVPLGNVNSVDIAPVYNPVTQLTSYDVMITNQNGVYELTQDSVTGNWDVDWMLPASVYVDMYHDAFGNVLGTNPLDFRPVYARRTQSGSVLIVNGYVGNYLSGNPFGGAVVEVDGSFAAAPGNTGFNFGNPLFGFSGSSFHFLLPPVENGRPIEGPIYADRRF